jgi:hypothetical protein
MIFVFFSLQSKWSVSSLFFSSALQALFPAKTLILYRVFHLPRHPPSLDRAVSHRLARLASLPGRPASLRRAHRVSQDLLKHLRRANPRRTCACWGTSRRTSAGPAGQAARGVSSTRWKEVALTTPTKVLPTVLSFSRVPWGSVLTAKEINQFASLGFNWWRNLPTYFFRGSSYFNSKLYLL